MSRISQLLADSLSQIELNVLQNFLICSDGWADIDLRVLDILGDLRLVETDSNAGSPKITALGRSVLYERITSDLKVPFGEKNLKFSMVVGAKIKAHVIASQARNMAHQALNGNFLSDGEH